MTRSIDTTEYIETVLSLLECQKTDVPVPIKGNSMVPFLREGDTVYLNSLTNEPKRGDVVLFRRADGSFVLHRIAKRLPDKSYLLPLIAQIPVCRWTISLLLICTSGEADI